MNNSLVIYEVKKSIAYITINRSEKLNALNRALLVELKLAWTRFEKDDNAKVAILIGAGKHFGVGADISEIPIDTTPGFPNVGAIVTKPVIAAIRGYCCGASFFLAMYCDMRVASENTQFLFPEVRAARVGPRGNLIPEYLPIGLALEFMLTGEGLTVQRAYDVGFVNRITSDEELMKEATKLGQKIIHLAPLTLKACKMLVYGRVLRPYFQDAMEKLTLIEPQDVSEDVKEAQRAFAEKRKPRFTGK